MGSMISGKLWIGIVVALSALNATHAQDAVKIDPDNPKYLLFRGKPLALDLGFGALRIGDQSAVRLREVS